ncbi:MAG: hypothetical protein Q7T16_04795 [Candidatus Burarchaeum sp.]|nr:hypothetical protein [Candidatus Burarchaeum sp.]MDO8339947.1 hypothetical protein [Candidatus Burarchaeum sp.]
MFEAAKRIYPDPAERQFRHAVETYSLTELQAFLLGHKEEYAQQPVVLAVVEELRRFIKDMDLVLNGKHNVPEGIDATAYAEQQDAAYRRVGHLKNFTGLKDDAELCLLYLSMAFGGKVSERADSLLMADQHIVRTVRCAPFILGEPLAKEAKDWLDKNLDKIMSHNELGPSELMYIFMGGLIDDSSQTDGPSQIREAVFDLTLSASRKNEAFTASAAVCLVRAMIGKTGTEHEGKLLQPLPELLLKLAETHWRDTERMFSIVSAVFHRFYWKDGYSASVLYDFTMRLAQISELARLFVGKEYIKGYKKGKLKNAELLEKGCVQLVRDAKTDRLLSFFLFYFNASMSERVMEILEKLAQAEPARFLKFLDNLQEGDKRGTFVVTLKLLAQESLANRREVIPFPPKQVPVPQQTATGPDKLRPRGQIRIYGK